MEEIYTWIKDVLLVIISISFFEILIPDAKTEKYIKLIFSLIILAIIIEPITAFINKSNI